MRYLCYHGPMAKLSVTLAEGADRALRALALEHGTNHSVVTEAAVMHLAHLPAFERERLIRGIHASKKAYTRGRWRAAFWDAVYDEFWFAQELRSGRLSDYTPLTFAGFQIWFQTDRVAEPDPEDAPFYVQVMANPNEQRLSPKDTRHQFTFSRDLSPYDAALEVANFIRDRVSALGTLEIVELPGGGRALLDHAGPHWMAQPEIDPTRLPIAVNGETGSFILEYRYVLRRRQT